MALPSGLALFPSAFVRSSKIPVNVERNAMGVKLYRKPWQLRCCNEVGASKHDEALHYDCQRVSDLEQPGTQLSSGIQRRQAVLGSILAGVSLSSFAVLADAMGSPSVSDQLASQVDVINGYTYQYPLGVAKGSTSSLNWVQSRQPERYSSAAPLSPDARQRIVSERLDLRNNVVVSVSVGPPNFTVLKDANKIHWDAKDVARSVLADKSTSRMTTGQRVTEVSIVDAHTTEMNGVRYWYYEYLVQKSPAATDLSINVFRHSVAVTAEREGYFYSLNASALESKWRQMGAVLQETVASFRLTTPTADYVSPTKDPWRFW